MKENTRSMLERNKTFRHMMETDPTYIDRVTSFTVEEVPTADPAINERSRALAVIATVMGCQGIDFYRQILDEALTVLHPIEVKEVLYQATAYLGLARIHPFIEATNEVLRKRGVKLPLPEQGTTTSANRREKGTEAQVAIFGEGMRDFWSQSTVNQWLAANCFGDYYTRKGLSLQDRELATFCYLAAQGGCEPQLVGHAKGNFRMGNSADFLRAIVRQCIPYIGYPRSLNALSAIDKAEQA